MLGELRDFIARGDVRDAVGLVMGAVFFIIVTSMMDDPANPIIMSIIVAWVVFLFVRTVNRVKESALSEAEKGEEEARDAPGSERLLTEIRDQMKANSATVSLA